MAWVVGALIPVALLDLLTEREGYFALGLGLAFATATYIGSLRTRGAWAGRVEHVDETIENDGRAVESDPYSDDDEISGDDFDDDSRPESGRTRG
ncbi:unannotated protein [freshwater metagenome]|uniref:Unannotated protein n=1 Tax=freshwater metagenome TaxID=449393 RepID=A0A6J7M4H4_9ZZZZ